MTPRDIIGDTREHEGTRDNTRIRVKAASLPIVTVNGHSNDSDQSNEISTWQEVFNKCKGVAVTRTRARVCYVTQQQTTDG